MLNIKMIAKGIFISIIILNFALNLGAVPAPPFLLDRTQPDGTKIKIRVYGDERFMIAEDENGFTIIKDSETGFFVYAEKDAEGKLKGTSFQVGKDDPDTLGLSKHLRPDKEIIKKLKAKRLGGNLLSLPKSAATIEGINKVVVILADFSAGSPVGHTKTVTDFNNLLLSDGTYSTGSMNDYFQEVSYGKLSLSGVVYDSGVNDGWVTVSENYSSYCNERGLGSTNNSQKLCEELVTAINGVFDFSAYADSDGYVNIVIVVEGTADPLDSNQFWPHMWELSSAFTVDGAKVRYILVNEQTDLGAIEPIGVFCHEFGHLLSAPDLYDTNDDYNYPVRWWGLMGFGFYGGSPAGTKPVHMSAFLKWSLDGDGNPSSGQGGWLSPAQLPVTISTPGTYTITRLGDLAADKPIAYKIPISSSEYFLVTNRGESGNFDDSVEDEGILIWHIDTSKDLSAGNVPVGGVYGVWLEAPYAGYDQTKATDRRNYILPYAAYSAEDLQTVFNAFSLPNSNSNAGGVTNISISNISASGLSMTFSASPAATGGGGGGGGCFINSFYQKRHCGIFKGLDRFKNKLLGSHIGNKMLITYYKYSLKFKRLLSLIIK
jgi:M6 family metalloprotease-like protein